VEVVHAEGGACIFKEEVVEAILGSSWQLGMERELAR
jgi:hypothetical protein